jgi:hypothetical protein
MADQSIGVPPPPISSSWIGQWRITGGSGRDIVHIESDPNDPSGLRIHYGPDDNHMTNLFHSGPNPEILAGDIRVGAGGAVWASFVWVLGLDNGNKYVNGCWWDYKQAGSRNWDLLPA